MPPIVPGNPSRRRLRRIQPRELAGQSWTCRWPCDPHTRGFGEGWAGMGLGLRKAGATSISHSVAFRWGPTVPHRVRKPPRRSQSEGLQHCPEIASSRRPVAAAAPETSERRQPPTVCNPEQCAGGACAYATRGETYDSLETDPGLVCNDFAGRHCRGGARCDGDDRNSRCPACPELGCTGDPARALAKRSTGDGGRRAAWPRSTGLIRIANAQGLL
jgi:hypothetical protein